jgi:hypothetical protein
MNHSIKNIISQVYELEGLLLLIQNHAQNTDPYVFELVRQKAEKIAGLSTGLTPDMFEDKSTAGIPEENIIAGQSAEDTDDAPVYECLGADTCCDDDYDDEPDEEICATGETETTDAFVDDFSEENFEDISYDDEDTRTHDDGEEFNEIWSSDYTEPNKVEGKQNVVFNNIEDEEPLIPQGEDEEDTEKTAGLGNVSFLDEEDKSEIPDYDGNNNSNKDIVTVDEALSRTLSKNLKQAFTLNDRFRYRRELFGNSDVEMNNTLNIVETMDSFTEAEDYFYGDLEWDKDSPEVADFMTIIRNHFL